MIEGDVLFNPSVLSIADYSSPNGIAFNNDCLFVMPLIPDKSIDMILCDLPYGTTQCKWDAVIPFDSLWEQYNRIIKKNGIIALFGSEPFVSALICSNLKQFKYDWIWHKPAGVGFLNAKRMPLRNHEHIAIFCNGSSSTKYNPQKWQSTPYSKMQKTVGLSDCYGNFKNERNASKDGTRYPNSIIFGISNAKKEGLHPTQKPIELFEYLIKTYSNEGDTILDNCSGSGTTGVACIKNERKFIMIEKNKQYFDIGIERVEKIDCNTKIGDA